MLTFTASNNPVAHVDDLPQKHFYSFYLDTLEIFILQEIKGILLFLLSYFLYGRSIHGWQTGSSPNFPV